VRVIITARRTVPFNPTREKKAKKRLPATLPRVEFIPSALESILSQFLVATKSHFPETRSLEKRGPGAADHRPRVAARGPQIAALASPRTTHQPALSSPNGSPLTALTTLSPQLPPLPRPPLCYSRRRTRVPPSGLRASAPAHPIGKREPSPIPSRMKAPGSPPCGRPRTKGEVRAHPHANGK